MQRIVLPPLHVCCCFSDTPGGSLESIPLCVVRGDVSGRHSADRRVPNRQAMTSISFESRKRRRRRRPLSFSPWCGQMSPATPDLPLHPTPRPPVRKSNNITCVLYRRRAPVADPAALQGPAELTAMPRQ
jgi:hypothetical protein